MEHIFPFLWLKGESREAIGNEIQAIYDSGLRAFCVESRPHPDFCGEKWWSDLDFIFALAEKLGMHVWILDDIRYPTGYACDKVIERPDLQQRRIAAKFVDAVGRKNGRITQWDLGNDRIIYAAAYPHEKDGVNYSKPVCLTSRLAEGMLYFDLPEGELYRIATIVETRGGGRRDRMDMINPASVDLLVDNVYEPHYARYAKYFGNVFQGFFSDEPGFFNDYNENFVKYNLNIYTTGLGTDGHAFPYSEEVNERLRARIAGFDESDYIALWQLRNDRDCEIRIAYMDIISDLYRDCFTERVGKWCRDRGARYVGHIIEDMNCHLMTGRGPGHYFKSQSGQDMAGVDVVLHQIKPYSTEYDHVAPISGYYSSPDFFCHTLASLAASAAALDERKHGDSLCEVFGAYGWGENVRNMKYLVDLMLVGGINHFVPHAFSSVFPNNDCPPHFFCGGKNPEYPAFGRLMEYAEYGCELFSGGKPKIDIGVLYHAESCWSGKDYTPVDKVLKTLHENGFNALIVPSYALRSADVKLIVAPYAEFLSEELKNELGNLGKPVIFAGKGGERDIVKKLSGFRDVEFGGECKNLRFYHYVKDGEDGYMFFNAGGKRINATADLKKRGEFAVRDFLGEYSYAAKDGKFALDLEPGASVTVCRGKAAGPRKIIAEKRLTAKFKASVRAYDKDEFAFYKTITPPFDLCAADEMPSFSGTVKFECAFTTEKCKKLLAIDGADGSVRAALNGKDLGYRICPPYVYDISDCVLDGENALEITMNDTLANALRDKLSQYDALAPLGFDGIRLIDFENDRD